MCLGELKYCEMGICCEVGKLVLFSLSFENFFSFIINEFIDYLLKMFIDKFVLDVKIMLFVGGFFECELV